MDTSDSNSGRVIATFIGIMLVAMLAGAGSSARATERRTIAAAEAAAEVGDWPAAARLFETALTGVRPITFAAETGEAYAGRGIARFHNGDLAGASSDFASAAANGIPAERFHGYRSLIDFRSDDFASGYARYQDHLQRGERLSRSLETELTAYAALALFDRGETGKALESATEVLREALLLPDELRDRLYSRMVGHYGAIGDWETAGDAAERLLKTNAGSIFAESVLAYRDYLDHNVDRAYERADAILASDPGDGLALLLRAIRSIENNELDAAVEDLTGALDRYPDEPHAASLLVYVMLRQERFPEAAAAGRALSAAAPGSAFTLWAEAMVHSANYEDDLALEKINLAIDLDPERPEFYVTRANSYTVYTDFRDLARADIEKALEIDPDHIPSRIALAWLENSFYHRDLLETTGLELIETWPNSIEGYAMLSSYYGSQADFDTALAYAEQGVEAEPQSAGALINRGYAYLALEDYGLARADFEAADKRVPFRIASFFALSDLQQAEYHLDDAIASLENVMRLNPDSRGARLELAYVYYQKDDLETGWEYLDELRDLDSSWPEIYFLRAVFYAAAEELDLALSELDKVETELPDKSAVHSLRANIYFGLGDYSQASISAKRAIRLYPADTNAYRILALVEIEQGELSQAHDYLDQALAYFDTDASLHAVHGWAYFVGNRESEALASYNRAIELDETTWNYYFERGLVRMYMDDFPGAQEDMAAAAELVQGSEPLEFISAYSDYIASIPEPENGVRSYTGTAGRRSFSIDVQEGWAILPIFSEGPLALDLYVAGADGIVSASAVIVEDLALASVDELVAVLTANPRVENGFLVFDALEAVQLGELQGYRRGYRVDGEITDRFQRSIGVHYYFYQDGVVICFDIWWTIDDPSAALEQFEAMLSTLTIH